MARSPTLTHFLLRPLALPFTLLLLVMTSVLWAFDQSALASRHLDEAQARLNQIGLLTRAVLDSETGVRGYMLAGEGSYLTPYHTGQVALRRSLSTLQQHPSDVVQYQNLEQVRFLAQRWNDEVATPQIQARRHIGQEVSSNILDSDYGKRLMDQIRQVLQALEASEIQHRETARQDSLSALNLTRWLSGAGLSAAAALLLLSAFRSARTLSKAVQAFNRDVSHIAQGDYAAPLPQVPIRELRLLATQFQVMVSAVQERQTRLERSNADLERSNRELEQFAYIASHDLQEPLRTIGSYTELLAKRYQGKLDERADKYIGFTLAATHRMKRLIQDLLAYSRVRQPGRELVDVDCNALLSEVQSDLEQFILSSGAQVSVAPLPTVRANPELLRHIFLNLLSNAIKFRDPQRPVQVQVSSDTTPQEWRFFVSDNGSGIAPEYHERIFGVFQRLGQQDEQGKVLEGSGIGLAVVRSAAERHGGGAQVSSEVGVGSTFSFTLGRPETHPTPDTTS